MSSAHDHVQGLVVRLKPGEHICFAGRLFREAYPCGWPSIYETHEQSFLSKQMGSAWGAFRVQARPDEDVFEVSRHHPDERRRVYVDPDREHLYRRAPDGSYAPKENRFTDAT